MESSLNRISDRGKKHITAISGSGILIASYDLAAISIALLVLTKQWKLDGAQTALLGSSALIGAILGGVSAGLLADRFGRKSLLILDFITYIVASIGSAVAPDYTWLVIFRFIVGIGIGADFAVIFPYLAETRPVGSRGKSMAIVMLAANFGMVIAYGLGGAFLLLGPYGWRLVLATGGFIAIPMLMLRSRISESGPWVRKRTKSLRKIIKSFDKSDRKKVTFTSLAWFSYQVSDQGLSLFLPIILLTTLNLGNSGSAFGSLLVKAVTIPAAVLTVYFIERVGRKKLQTVGFMGRAIPLIAIAALLVFFGTAYAWIEITMLLIAYFFGAMGPDKTIVISPSEQFSTEKRGTGQGISESFGRLGGLIGVAGYGILSVAYGPWAGLLLFGGFALFGFFITRLYMKETASALSGLQDDAEI